MKEDETKIEGENKKKNIFYRLLNDKKYRVFQLIYVFFFLLVFPVAMGISIYYCCKSTDHDVLWFRWKIFIAFAFVWYIMFKWLVYAGCYVEHKEEDNNRHGLYRFMGMWFWR